MYPLNINHIKNHAIYRNLEFSITIKDAWTKLVEQKMQCALTGIEISVDKQRMFRIETNQQSSYIKFMLEPRRLSLKDINYKIMEDDPDVHGAFIQANGTIPSVIRIAGPFIYNEALEIVKSSQGSIQEWDYEDLTSRGSVFRHPFNGKHVFVRIKRSFSFMDSFQERYMISQDKKKKYAEGKKNNILLTGEIEILYDIQSGPPKAMIDQLKKLKIKENFEHNEIGLVCQDPDTGRLYTKDFPIVKKGKYDFDLDLHYGEGFLKFHDACLKRIDNSKKGIMLLHGVPGTGKTMYIRRLICDLLRRDKKIIYLPSSMVEMLGSPMFNDFMLNTLEEQIDDGNTQGILIIIEDAERVLMKREGNPNADLVSNVLNGTDGILNDILSIQMVMTFNCDLRSVDSAILRKRRAIAIREFRRLTKEESQKLIDKLEIQYKASDSMTIAEIYSLVEEADDRILLDTEEKKAIGFK